MTITLLLKNGQRMAINQPYKNCLKRIESEEKDGNLKAWNISGNVLEMMEHG